MHSYNILGTVGNVLSTLGSVCILSWYKVQPFWLCLQQAKETKHSIGTKKMPKNVNDQKSCFFTKLTVEPVLFLYMGAIMISTVVEDAFFVHKACMVDVGLSANVCDHINAEENKELNKKVQLVVSNFHQYANIAANIVPMCLALYLGVWSDRKGRKLPLLLGLFGSLYYWLALWVNSLQGWSLYAVLYTATFPAALTGNSLAIFMASFSYICDISSPESRTVRVTLLEFAYLVTMPTGVALGSYLFNKVFQRSFSIMFLITSFGLALSIIYTWSALKWRTTSAILTNTQNGCKSTALETFKVVAIPKKRNHTFYFLLVVFALGVYTFQRDEKIMLYLYTQLKFHWDVAKYSSFRTLQSTFLMLGLLFGVPLLSRVLKLRDTIIIMIGALSHVLARIIYAAAEVSTVFFAGTVVGALGPIVAPVLRSIASKLIPSLHRGKAFALLSVADTAVPIISGPIYTFVYNSTIDFAPASIFVVTIISQMIVFGSALVIHCMQGGMAVEQAKDEEADSETSSVTGSVA